MIRWRYCVVLAMLLLLPPWSEALDDDDDEGSEENEDGEAPNEDDDDDADDPVDKSEPASGRRASPALATAKAPVATRTTKKRPLDCYVCAYKSELPVRKCLEPAKYNVHTITCHNPDDKCFTSVVAKSAGYESVVRGCRSGCVGSPNTTCCELSRCNNQPFVMPEPPAPRMRTSSKAKTLQPTVVLFVTVLLILQTVVKVSFV